MSLQTANVGAEDSLSHSGMQRLPADRLTGLWQTPPNVHAGRPEFVILARMEADRDNDDAPGDLPSLNASSQASFNELMPAVYEELRHLAASYLRGERPDHTLQPTALVHEAYLRLARQKHIDERNRADVLGFGARI